MAMIVQLSVLLRVCVVCADVVVYVIVLVAGEGSNTIADDVRTCGGERKTLLFPHRRRHHHRNNQLRTISTRKGYACVTITHNRDGDVKCIV